MGAQMIMLGYKDLLGIDHDRTEFLVYDDAKK